MCIVTSLEDNIDEVIFKDKKEDKNGHIHMANHSVVVEEKSDNM